jgi:hypothetical protein
MVTGEQLGNELNRSVKLAIDSGEVATLEEARAMFEGYRLCVLAGSDVALSPTKQAALLTAVNTGRRCFLGGVQVRLNSPDAELLIPWRDCETLGQAVVDLHGTVTGMIDEDIPQIVIGDIEDHETRDFAVRATFDGWRGGVVPIDDGMRLDEVTEFTPAGVLAAALAVSEAFQHIRGRNALAGHRPVGLSLWEPDSGLSWLDDPERGPVLEYLPSSCWLIGLGHLGQAYLWTLGFLPYANPGSVHLVLQDYDDLVRANDSTSLLTDSTLIGQKKTRAMAEWCEQRGFRARICERKFAGNFLIDEEEPQVALCGVDNEPARAALEDVGFCQIIEAGLGRGTEEYLGFQIHCFPSRRTARDRWAVTNAKLSTETQINQPVYESLAAGGMDKCGLTMLANRSVGASFVGAFTATLVISELLRMSLGKHRYGVIDGSLRSPESFAFVRSASLFDPFNPGITRASKQARQLNRRLIA